MPLSSTPSLRSPFGPKVGEQTEKVNKEKAIADEEEKKVAYAHWLLVSIAVS